MKTVLLAAGLLFAASAHPSHEIAISAEQMQRMGIALGTVEPAESSSTGRLPARVVIPPQQQRVLSAPQGGLVTRLRAAVGDAVAKGQVLAEIDSPDLVALQRDFLQAVTEAHLARTELERDRRLHQEGIIAERRYLETRSRHEEAVATLEARRQALGLAGMRPADVAALEHERRLSSTLQVTAPLGGVVLAQHAVIGQRVDRAEPLYRIGQLEPLWLELRVPVDRLAGVAAGSPVQVPGCAQTDARVVVVGQDVDPDSQTVLVRASISGVDGCLRPGQFLQVSLHLSSERNQYRVPSSAVVRSGQDTVVFVREPNGFVPVPVEVSGRDGDHAVVAGDIAAGQEIAASGLAAIKAAWLGMGGE